MTESAGRAPRSPVLHPAVREATPRDVPRIRELIVELASYEHAADRALASDEQLQTALFGEQPAVFALVVEAEGQVVGVAIWFLNFSTWEGVHGIYLEDLYVRPGFRGSGYGKALLQSLASTAVARGLARVEWSVLDWNTPSIDFYRAMGAVSMDEWTVFRLSGEALRSAAL